jgi:hypothetical protein
MVETPSLTDLQQEEERIRKEEDGEIERKRQAAARLATQRGLSVDEPSESEDSVSETKETKREPPIMEDIEEVPPDLPETSELPVKPPAEGTGQGAYDEPTKSTSQGFVPARLPHFG